MKRFTLAVLTLVVMSVTLAACGSQPKKQAPPPTPPEQTRLVVPVGWLQVEKYPVIARKHAMTDVELQELGLRRAELSHQTLFYNHYRALGKDKKGGWRHEVLPAGTGVAADKDGRAWYKLDCSNRLYAPVERVATTPPPAGKPGNNGENAPPTSGQSGPGGWSPWLLPLLLATAVGGIIWWIWRRITSKDNLDGNDPMAWTRTPGAEAATGTTAAGAAAATTATTDQEDGAQPQPDTAIPTDRLDRVERYVAGIRESLMGLEDRVVTRLEPTVREAVDNGGKARARNALAEQVVAAGARNNMPLVNALNRALTALE